MGDPSHPVVMDDRLFVPQELDGDPNRKRMRPWGYPHD